MVRLLVTGPREKRFAPQPRVKPVQRHESLWEVTWAVDGRATFEYGAEVQRGEPHIIWRRVGTHAIFGSREVMVTEHFRPHRPPGQGGEIAA